jgi:2-oxoglutarate ferredoxin oxidoreductase subunit alpha
MALTADAFELAERYRTPVMILTDGVLGQAMEPVELVFREPARVDAPWALTGAAGRPPRVVRSLHLKPEDLEVHNLHLQAKFAAIADREVRHDGEHLDDADLVIVAYGTAARVARTAIARAREQGLRAGLFRPITLWPFPSDALRDLAGRVRGLLVVEMSAGQMVEDVRLAVEGRVPVAFTGRTGGMVPAPSEVVAALHRLRATTAEQNRETPR